MQSYYIKLNSFYNSLGDVKPSQPYSYTYGDRPVFEFSFLPNEIAEGDTLVYAIDNDMVFYDSAPSNLLHSASCMVVVRHDVTAEEATAGKVQLRIETRTLKFRDVTNGKVRPVEVISGLYRRRGNGDDLNYVLMAKGRAFANGIIADYDALPEPITIDEYYTKGDIDGLLGEKADESTLVAHTDNADIHVTLQDKSTWDSKADVTDIGNATVTITQGGVSKGSFSVNATDNVTIEVNDGAQADWDETDTTSPSYIRHKPSVYTKTETDGLLNDKADKTSVYTKGETDAKLDGKADVATTYTKTETDALLDGKADKATTLAGYGIADAYTKTEVDAKVSSVYRYKGTVSTYADLPSSGQEVGDVWNIETADSAHDIKAGDNVAWNGTTWDALAGEIDLTAYPTKSELATVATTGDYNDLSNRPDLTTKLDAPAVAGAVGQVLTKTADGQEWKDFGIDDIVQECQTIRDQTQAIYDSVRATVATYYVGPAYNYGVTVDGTMLSFTWTDPADNNVVKWARTRLVMKTGGFPADENDGTALIDVTERNQHKTAPFTWDAGVISGYYFALFTQATGGVWYTGDDCPRFTTDELTWATIAMMSRAGTLLQYPGMKIGSVVDIKVNDMYPKLRYRLADIDYSGSFTKVSDFMYDNTRNHNSIWIPNFLPSLGDGNSTASMLQFDAPESSYGATWDDVFVTDKAYYIISGESYIRLTSGTDYQDGEMVAEWQTLHGETVYSKNHPDRAMYGNNIWKESNIRQWMNSSGIYWFNKQNEYDVMGEITDYARGWLTDFDPGFLDLVVPVRNKTARNTVLAIDGGGGGDYDITIDKFWIPSIKEVSGSDVNNIAEGEQFTYFRKMATTNKQRIQYDDGGVARTVWLRSPSLLQVQRICFIYTNGEIFKDGTVSKSYAHLHAMCI